MSPSHPSDVNRPKRFMISTCSIDCSIDSHVLEFTKRQPYYARMFIAWLASKLGLSYHNGYLAAKSFECCVVRYGIIYLTRANSSYKYTTHLACVCTHVAVAATARDALYESSAKPLGGTQLHTYMKHFPVSFQKGNLYLDSECSFGKVYADFSVRMRICCCEFVTQSLTCACNGISPGINPVMTTKQML